MGDSQQAEIRLRFVIDGDGARVMDTLTSATLKAAKAEDEYQKKLKARADSIREQRRMTADLVRQGVIEGPRPAPTFEQTVSRAERAVRQQQAVREELVRRGVIEGPKAPLTIAEEARQRAATITRQAAVREELVQMGAVAPPPKGPGAGETAVMEGAEALGVAGLGRMGPAALALYAGKAGIEASIRSGQIDADAYMSMRQKLAAQRRELPLFGWGYGKATDLLRTQFSDDERLFQRAVRSGHEGVFEGSYEGRAFATRQTLGVEEQIRRAQAGMSPYRANDLRLDRPAGYDRGSVLGARLFREEEQLLQQRHEMNRAAKDRVDAERRAGLLEAAEGNLVRERTQLQRRLVQVQSERHVLGMDTSQDSRNRAALLAAEESKLSARLGEIGPASANATQQAAAAREEAARARARERQAGIGFSEAAYAVARQREERVAGQAERLGSLDQAGYLQARFAFQMVKQLGIENVPREIAESAAGYAPETIQKLRRDFGESRLGLAQREVGREEYDRTDIGSARQEANRAREEQIRGQEQAATELATGLADAVRGVLGKVLEEFKRQMEQQKLDLDAHTRNSAAGF